MKTAIVKVDPVNFQSITVVQNNKVIQNRLVPVKILINTLLSIDGLGKVIFSGNTQYSSMIIEIVKKEELKKYKKNNIIYEVQGA